MLEQYLRLLQILFESVSFCEYGVELFLQFAQLFIAIVEGRFESVLQLGIAVSIASSAVLVILGEVDILLVADFEVVVVG